MPPFAPPGLLLAGVYGALRFLPTSLPCARATHLALAVSRPALAWTSSPPAAPRPPHIPGSVRAQWDRRDVAHRAPLRPQDLLHRPAIRELIDELLLMAAGLASLVPG